MPLLQATESKRHMRGQQSCCFIFQKVPTGTAKIPLKYCGEL